ncbi:MAG: hypothetical protein J6J62_02420 [Oscillospiraceae bacterium]|nr:hypothetical protein [Oscillospiraceae bacterium]
MRGKLIDLSLGLNRRQRVTVELLADFEADYNRLKDGDVSIEIKKYRKPRSLNANSYFHVLCEKIAVATKQGNDEVKKQMVMEYGTYARLPDGGIAGATLPAAANPENYYPYAKWYKDMEIDGREYSCYIFMKRTSEMDTAEFSRLLEGTIRDAKELGIETMTPAELERLEGYDRR